ncbi:hypothetical protein K503DRAFT_768195 [Rhizopogon vinicolor AM-OR11-026]|uniref:Oxidoreductase AflY n=1 Tax=Rhizopogon vinicolor AM-OR11-026 TaxID=1314800 RepID=A0A1B7N7J5_9AGAM|nr:hypothetical protein K503DRAFT_768195 [Rhizopogon vinicolor AM-OR11-026]
MTAVKHTRHDSDLETLFPAPSLPPTVLCPQLYAGSSPEAVAALRHVLKDNHIKHHIFFNDAKFHNHITHRALALYATGASGALIEHLYKQDSMRQLPVVEPPEAITEKNFIDHLGDDTFYAAYMTFFAKAIEEKGVSATLEDYVFAEKYNFVEGRDLSTQPVMLARFFAALFHAFIHVGYGIEFGIPGLVAEGLAMTSVHESQGPMFLPSSLLERGSTSTLEETTTRLSSLLLNTKTSIAPSRPEQSKGNHAFSILAKIMQDAEFAPKKMEKYFDGRIGVLLTEHGAKIWRYAEQWTIDLSQRDEIERKIEECIWTTTIMYGIGGWSKENGFKADFFLMHLVTSSLFLPALVSYLPQDSQVILLRAYFALTLAWWISRGCPRPDDIQGFLTATNSHLSSDGEVPLEANPFLDIVRSGSTHSNEHVLKIQRTFAHFSSVYGVRPKGYFTGTELEGAEVLDGSLFLRAARLTDEHMSHGTKSWSFEGFSEN